MPLKLLKIVGYTLPVLLLSNCAQIGVLTGGERDTTPPKLLQASPENKTPAFNSNIILLKFDEYVQLKDLNNQLVISPKMKTKPEITAQGKKVTIKLKAEELLPNTTYVLYFGNAIADMHEGNSLTNFSYVFSTGSQIDTMVVSGNVVGAYSGKPERDMVVGLYFGTELSDSFPFKQIPDYVCRSGNDGNFRVENLPMRPFRIVCFSDKNKDYLYNGPEAEKIGFYDKEIIPGKDSLIKLNLFTEKPDKVVLKKTIMSEYGKGQLIFNQPVKVRLETFVREQKDNFYQLNSEKESDTCSFYYRNLRDSLWLICYYSSFDKDTLILRVPSLKVKPKRTLKPQTNFPSGKIPWFESPYLDFGFWLDETKFNPNKVKLISKKDTSYRATSQNYKWLNPGKLEFNYPLVPKTDYLLLCDTGIFYTSIGTHNDSLKYSFSVLGKNEFGKLNLKITFPSKRGYIVQLLNSEDRKVAEEFIRPAMAESNQFTVSFDKLWPGSYKLMVVYDENENKRWDSGNFLKKLQPERIYYHQKPLKVIPDWEVEEEIFITR